MPIKIKKHDDRALFFQVHVGEAEQGDIKILIGTNVADGSLIAIAKNAATGVSATYSLSTRSFVEEVIAAELGETEYDAGA